MKKKIETIRKPHRHWDMKWGIKVTYKGFCGCDILTFDTQKEAQKKYKELRARAKV